MSETGTPLTTSPAPLAERFVAALIDIVIVCGLCLFPRIGWMFGLIYLLTRDALPFLNGQSFGKKLMHLKVVTQPNNSPLTSSPEKSVIRGIVFLIPVLNLIDVLHLYTKGQRLADKWAETEVIVHNESVN
jgi:uncharacterized RDD family membrane protein YckC